MILIAPQRTSAPWFPCLQRLLSGGWWNLFEGGLNVCIPNPKRGVWGHPPPQDFFVIFTNKRSILVHSDKIVKSKKEHLLTKTNGTRELSFKYIFCLVEISNIKDPILMV
jgi:hypothetical protein